MGPKQQTSSVGSPPGSKKTLPPKEQSLFKSVVRFYEMKQLKKALKSADTILKKYQDHGETLAMKGLVLNAFDKKEEATDLVRRGLRNDMKSHICWHVYGLLYRSRRDYREAAKAYVNALRIEPDNQQILRDLASLQVQIRDYEGLEETRRRLLTVRPNHRNNWIGFVVSHHLLGNHSTALSILDSYYNTLSQANEVENAYQTSEILLYKNLILEESGQYREALDQLDSDSHKLVDPLAVMEAKVRLLSKCEDYSRASDILRELIEYNPDNQAYQRALLTCVLCADYPEQLIRHDERDVERSKAEEGASNGLRRDNIVSVTFQPKTDEQITRILSLCDELHTKYPSSHTSSLISLDIIPDGNHPEFLPRLEKFVRAFVRKGIPSLFSSVKMLYKNPSKVKAIENLFTSYLSSLESSSGQFLPPSLQKTPDVVGKDDDKNNDKNNSEKEDEMDRLGVEPPCTELWVYHFLGQHYDRVRDYERGLEMIERGIAHTPTAIECHVAKGRILKHCGDLKGAVQVLNEARNLDLADRYLNSKCSKYGLRADMVSEAELWIALFTRDSDTGGVQALYDLQCMWFELEAAESHLRCGELSQALKKFTAVERHFGDIIEDQFDFHSYCLREVTLRAYVTLLRYEDNLRRHEYFFRAARGLVKCLLEVGESGEEGRRKEIELNEHSDIKGFAQMSESQQRKALSKKKKQLARKRTGGSGNKGNAAKSGVESSKPVGGSDNTKSSSGTGESKGKANSGWMETDPMGHELVKELLKGGKGENEGVLKEASRIINEMLMHLNDRLETQKLAFDVALRRRKYLQALRAVKQAEKLGGVSSEVVGMRVRLAHDLRKEEVKAGLSELSKQVLSKEGDILDGKNGKEFVDGYLERLSKNEIVEKLKIGRLKLWMCRVGEAGCDDEGLVGEWIVRVIEEGVENKAALEDEEMKGSFCMEYLREIRKDGIDSELVDRIREAMARVFPRASRLRTSGGDDE